jgi:hypothetical protein
MEEGHRVSGAACFECGRIDAYFERRTVRLSESGAEVPDVLVGVCTQCDAVILLPAESVPKVKEARDRLKEQ